MSFLRYLFGDPTRYDVDKINIGDTKEQVIKLFGRPDSITKGLDPGENLVWTIPFRLYVSIDFDHEAKVIRKYSHEEVS